MDLQNLEDARREIIPDSHIFNNVETDDEDDPDTAQILKEMFGMNDDNTVDSVKKPPTPPKTNGSSTDTWEMIRAQQQAQSRARMQGDSGHTGFDINEYKRQIAMAQSSMHQPTGIGHYANIMGTRNIHSMVTYNGVRPKGLFNFGNTCFMNVILQVLMSLNNFQSFIQSDLSRDLMLEKQSKLTTDKSEIVNNINNSVTYNLRNLFEQLIDTNNKMSIRPDILRKRLGKINSMFTDDAQQDVAEALCILIGAIHDEHSQDVSSNDDGSDSLKTACGAFWAKDHSPIVDLFYSMCQEKKSCPKCSHEIITYCPYAYIHLDVPKIPDDQDVNYIDHLFIKAKNPSVKLSDKEIEKMVGCLSEKTKAKLNLLDRNKREKTQEFSLDECILNYFKPGMIEDAVCGECKAIGYKNKVKISIVPKILTLQIKRFDGIDKKFNPINLKENIQLVINGVRHEYKISAVINHSGLNIQSGHYYMYGKNRTYNKLSKDKWFQFNDGSVTTSAFDQITLSDVYMIFYELD